MNLHQITTNWKTSAVGVIQFVLVLLPQVSAQIDSNPETVADWNLVITAAVILLGLLTARDSDKSSQQNKIRPAYINMEKSPFSNN